MEKVQSTDIYKILIGLKVNIKDDDKKIFIKNCANKFLLWLNHKLGAETTLEYQVNPIENETITFIVKKYNNDQIEKSLEEEMKNKIEIIKKYCLKLPENQYNNFVLYCLRGLEMKFGNISKIFFIRGIKKNKVLIDEDLVINHPKILYPSYKIDKLIDGSTLRQFIDPYVKHYGVFVDYSKKLSEMSYSYNGLHVFEHYMTYCWKNYDEKDILTMNGATYPCGLCLIYSISSNYDEIVKRFLSAIKFQIESTDIDFIKKTKALSVETIRTISETYTTRNLTSLGRSDQQAYDGEYMANIFAYYASQPINILYIGNKEMKLNINELNIFYREKHRDISKLTPISFSHIPNEIFEAINKKGHHILHKNTEKILKNLYCRKDTCVLYGVDCREFFYENEQEFINKKHKKLEKADISTAQTIVQLLLIFAKYCNKETIEKYVKHNNFPYNVLDYNDIPTKNMYNYLTMDEEIV